MAVSDRGAGLFKKPIQHSPEKKAPHPLLGAASFRKVKDPIIYMQVRARLFLDEDLVNMLRKALSSVVLSSGGSRRTAAYASPPSFSNSRYKSSLPRYSITIRPFFGVCRTAT